MVCTTIVYDGDDEVLDLVDDDGRGGLKPVIGARYPFEKVAEAMQHLSSRQCVGKIILHW